MLEKRGVFTFSEHSEYPWNESLADELFIFFTAAHTIAQHFGYETVINSQHHGEVSDNPDEVKLLLRKLIVYKAETACEDATELDLVMTKIHNLFLLSDNLYQKVVYSTEVLPIEP